MKTTFKCDRCGIISEAADHLCQPHELAGKQDYCGQPVKEAGPICGPMSKSLEYECGSCGRPAEEPQMLCHPAKL
jgi:hypothetical protein